MKALKWIGLALVTLFIVGAIAIIALDEKQPPINPTPEADALAEKMLSALNKPAWDSLAFLRWEFPGGHRYIFDKKANRALISWGQYEVDMMLHDQSGTTKINGQVVEGSQKQKLLTKAWGYWCNDSFWMFAPYKIFDPNTSRTIVDHQGKQALMVSYHGGGVTPGDSYLWILDDNHVPVAFKMWVSIIPIGGMQFSWDKWQTLLGGSILSTYHESSLFPLELLYVKEGRSMTELAFVH